MTLIIAVGCIDGVVLASDSASTDPDTGSMQPVSKVSYLEQPKILWGGSGDVGTIQKVGHQLENQITSLPSKPYQTRRKIKQIIASELNNSYSGFIPIPNQKNQPPKTSFLLVWVQNNKPWILEIDFNGTDTFYTEQYKWFYAIGSGKPWAMALFSRHSGGKLEERNLEFGKALAYRILEDSIKIAAGYIAEPIHISTISVVENSGHGFASMGQEDLKKIKDLMGVWREIEKESQGKFLSCLAGACDAGEEPSTEIPEPEE